MRRPTSLTGFTLFQNNKGWQMSIRIEGESGWSVAQISEEQAEAILSMLETSGHSDGPWTVVRKGELEAELWYLGRSLRGLTRAVGGILP